MISNHIHDVEEVIVHKSLSLDKCGLVSKLIVIKTKDSKILILKRWALASQF